MREDYRAWLEPRKYAAGTISSRISDAKRVESLYGDLDEHYRTDRMESVLATLRYSADDERHGRPNPSKLAIQGNVRNGLVSSRSAVELYRRFLEALDGADSPGSDAATGPAEEVADFPDARRFGFERDMQAALRANITQLEPGLEIIDGGSERPVASGMIDITARDPAGAIVVIELKTGIAGRAAVGQILSYMGDIDLEEEDAKVRGILIAGGFDAKAQAAARMVPGLALCEYAVRFAFSRVGQ